MLTEYIQNALKMAKYEILPEDQTYYGEIQECPGVYANSINLESCREELAEVLEEWILVRIHKNLPLPTISGINFDFLESA